MKKNKLFSAFAVLTAAATFFGCYNGTDLTKTWDKAESYNDKAVKNFSAPTTCEFSVNSNSSDLQANKKGNEVVIDFKSDFYLDESTLNAVSFFGITESENNYPTETALTSSVKTVTKAEDSGKVKTTVTYNVDLTSYNKKYIGAKIDATVLKDVNKNFVLNGNGNEKAGEATDSMYIDVLEVHPNKNGDAFTETLTVTKDDLKPFALKAPISATVTPTEADLLVTVPTWDSDLVGTKNTASAGTLGSIYKIQTIAPGESKWTDTVLSFEYAPTPIEAYVAAVLTLTPGTKYRLVKTIDPSVTVKYKDLDVPLTYISTKVYDVITDGVSSFYTSDTTTIVTKDAMPAIGDYGDPETVQDDFASVTRTPLTLAGYGARFEIEFDFGDLNTGTTDIGLSATEDFIVTTNKTHGYKKVPAKVVEAVKNDNGIVTKVIIETEESKKVNYLDSDLLVWAGSGVTITRNDKNAAQTHFGMPKDFAKKDASGYVQLN